MSTTSLSTHHGPAITLLTDFGLADHFAGVMKGVILGICPSARIVDISHEVTPFEIAQGAFLLGQSWRYFPAGTVHVAVVDPGVGSARRTILVAAEGHYFVAPDNGVLGMVYSGASHRTRHITNPDYFLQPVSRTFHGRDIFAPVAAHLANGVPFDDFGPEIDDYLNIAFNDPKPSAEGGWSGIVLHADRFGNLITSFHISRFADLEMRPFELNIGSLSLHRVALHYADIEPGEVAMIVGSSGYVEIVSNQASAAKLLGCGPGAPCHLKL